jgi:hypothetical protein
MSTALAPVLSPAVAGGGHRRLVRSELLKVTSTRMWLGMLVGVVLYIAVGVVATVFAPQTPGVAIPRLATPEGVRNLFGQAGGAYVFAIVIGALGMTQELRHQTLTSTLLAEPRRNAVMVAKMVAYAIVGAVYGLVGVVFGFGLSIVLLAFKDHAAVPWGDVAQIGAGAVLGCALFAVLGVAVGALVRNQIAAILGILVWVLIIESLLVQLLPKIGKWLPAGALYGILQTTGIDNAAYLPVWAATLVLLGYAAVLGAIAALTTQRRDVT